MAETPTPRATPRAPLAGRSVIVTRTREQAAALADPLEALGAEVIAFPVISIVDPEEWDPVDDAIARLGEYDWTVLTSTNGVERFLERLDWMGGMREGLLEHVAAVGSATAESLRAHGFESTLVPKDFRAEGLIDEFRRLGAGPGWRVLIPRALEAREVLPDALREMGCAVDVVPVYRSVLAEPDPAVLERLRAGRVDAITFTAGSTVSNFIAILEQAGLEPARVLGRLVVASIGPVTTETLHRAGFDPDVEAAESTIPALVQALAGYRWV